ncbi:hypothetical protein KY333_05845 [Candidatus Woesearchaeota archaeon]|nr:hypothetical protein [Candidatus Woesearchaeota archaeon]
MTKKLTQKQMLEKELKEIRKHRKNLEEQINLTKALEAEKEALKKAKHWKRNEKIRHLEKNLKKAFLVSEKGSKKVGEFLGGVKKFMKEDHIK